VSWEVDVWGCFRLSTAWGTLVPLCSCSHAEVANQSQFHFQSMERHFRLAIQLVTVS